MASLRGLLSFASANDRRLVHRSAVHDGGCTRALFRRLERLNVDPFCGAPSFLQPGAPGVTIARRRRDPLESAIQRFLRLGSRLFERIVLSWRRIEDLALFDDLLLAAIKSL